MTHRHVLAAVAGLVLCAAAHADLRLEYTATRGHAELASLSLGSDRLRLDPGRTSTMFDPDSSALIDPARTGLVLIDHAEHVYQQIDTATLAHFAGLAGLLGGTQGMQLSVRPTGAREHGGGHACEVFRIDLDGSHLADYCMADARELGLQDRDAATLQRSATLARSLLAQIGASFGAGVFAPGRLPVKLVTYHAGKISGLVELSGVGKGRLDANVFAIPPGYRAQPFDPSMLLPQ